MAEIKKLLDDAIETEIKNLNSASNKDEKSEVIKNLAALHKLRIEEIKTETEIEEKSERRAKLWVTIERRKQHGKQQGGSERERA